MKEEYLVQEIEFGMQLSSSVCVLMVTFGMDIVVW